MRDRKDRLSPATSEVGCTEAKGYRRREVEKEDEREMKTIKKEDACRERERREGDGGW